MRSGCAGVAPAPDRRLPELPPLLACSGGEPSARHVRPGRAGVLPAPDRRLPELPPSLTCSMAKGSIIEYAERCGRGAEE